MTTSPSTLAARFLSPIARMIGSMTKVAGSRQPARAVQGAQMMERLEDRVMLAADLNLQVTFPGATVTAAAGGNLAGSVTIRNTGNAAANGFLYRAVLSLDGTLGNGDDVVLLLNNAAAGRNTTAPANPNQPLVGEASAISIVAGGNNVRNLADYAIPAGLNPGAYTLFFTVDRTNAIAEDNENNNSFESLAAVPVVVNGPNGSANLNVSSTLAGTTLNPTQSLTIPTTIRNVGTAAAGAFNVTWALTTNRALTGDVFEIGTERVNSLAGVNGVLNTSPTFTLPVGIPTGTYFLVIIVDSDSEVTETNEGENTLISAAAIVNIQRPDLSGSFTSTLGATQVAPGQLVTGNLTINNTSAAGAGTFVASIFLSSDNAIGGDIFLGDVVVPANLTSGNAINGSTSRVIENVRLFLPFDVTPGSYRIVTVIDGNDDINESNEGNNSAITATAVVTVPARNTGNDPALGDFVVVGPTVTNLAAVRGGTLGFTATAANLGLGNLATSGVRAYLSTDNVLDAGDFVLSDDITGGALTGPVTPGSIQALSSVVVPNNAPIGNFYLILVADDDDNVTEANENNNTWTSSRAIVAINGAPTANPNLTATLGFAGGTFARGANITVPTTVRNTTTTAAGAFAVRYVLSTDNVIGNADDITLGTQNIANLAANGVTTISPTLTLPNNLPGQPYFLSVVVDSANAVTETNEADNTTTTATASLTISAPDLRAEVTSAAQTVSPTGTLNATLTVRNSTVVASGAFNVTLSLSSDNAIGGDILLQTFRISGLAGNGVQTIPVSLPLPWAVLPGSYRFIAQVDPIDEVFEANESNNNFIAATNTVTVPARNTANDPAGADLVARLTAVATSVAPLGTINATVQVSNQGNATTGSFVGQFYLSTNNTLSDSDIALGTVNFGALAPGATIATASLTVPGFVAAGTYFLLFRADDAGAVTETSESNNVATTATALVAITRPTVSITATAPNAVEPRGAAAAVNGVFTLTRTGPLTAGLTVNLLSSGTTVGSDFTAAVPTTVTFAPGAATATITLTPTVGGAEALENLTLTLDRGTGYDISATARAATITVEDSLPRVTVSVIDAAAAEPTGAATNTGVIRISRNGSLTGSLTVAFDLTGTALVGGGNNYTLSAPVAANLTVIANSGLVTIPANQAFVDITVNPIDDAATNAPRTVILTVAPSGSNAYSIGGGTFATAGTVTIADNEPTVSITATRAGSEPVGNGIVTNGLFTVTRVGGVLSQPLTVTYTISGTATSGTDFTARTGTVTIPANATTAQIEIPVLADAIVENTETVIATLTSGAAYNITSVAAQQAATVSITNSSPTITISAIDPIASEIPVGAAANVGTFRISAAGGNTASVRTVVVSISGTATNVTDYTLSALGAASITPSGGNFLVTIPAGATFADVVVTAATDNLGEGNETIIATVLADAAYNRGVEATRAATVTLQDAAPVISVIASDPAAGEGAVANTGTFLFTRTGGTLSQPLTINYAIGGTAVAGAANSNEDYVTLTGTVTFAANIRTATVVVTPINNTTGQGPRTVTASVSTGSILASPTQNTATVTIEDNETRLNVTPVGTVITEGLATLGTVRVTRPVGVALNTAFAFNFSLAGTAARTDDYTVSGGGVTFDVGGVGTATIPSGASFVDIAFTPVNDAVGEAEETIIFSLIPDPARYGVGAAATSTATIRVVDNEPTVTVAATLPNASEATGNNLTTNGAFTFTRTGASNANALTVTYTISGTATAGTDYTTLTGTVTIPAGQASVVVPVSVLSDGLAEDLETVIVTISQGVNPAYRLGLEPTRTATVRITDSTPTVTISAIRPVASETLPAGVAQPGTFRISRTGGNTASALSVTYTIGGSATAGTDYTTLTGTATIPAGLTFVDVPVTVINDLITEGAETVIATLSAANTYRFGVEATRTATVTINNANTIDLSVTGSTLPPVTNIAYNQTGVIIAGDVTVNNAGSDVTGATLTLRLLSGSGALPTDPIIFTVALPTLTNGDNTIPVAFPAGVISRLLPGLYNIQATVTGPAGRTEVTLANNSNNLRLSGGTGPAFINVLASAPAAGATVSVSATDATGAEIAPGLGSDSGQFTITRSGGDVSQRMVVAYTLTGTATDGTDYLPLARYVVLEPGQLSATVDVDVIDDTLNPVSEPRETVILTLLASNAYTVGGGGTATVSIDDNEAALVSISGTNGGENGTTATNGSIRISRTGNTASALTVFITDSNLDATSGVDYSALPTSVVIPAGQNFVDIPVNVIVDNVAESNEAIVVTLEPDAAYTISGSAFAAIAINDTTPTELQADAITGGPFNAAANTPSVLPVTINWTNNAAFDTNFTYRVYISTNNALELGTDPVAASGGLVATASVTGTTTINLNLPALAAGNYFLIFQVLPRGTDGNAGNNVASTATAELTIA